MINDKDNAIASLKIIAINLLKEEKYLETHTLLEVLMYVYRTITLQKIKSNEESVH